MNKTNKLRVLTVCVCLVLAAPMVASVLVPNPVSKVDVIEIPEATGNDFKFKIKEGFFGEFCAVGKSCVPLAYKENIITTVGFNLIKQMMGGVLNSSIKYLALGNGTTVAVGDTTLNSEQTDCGLARATGTYYDLGTGWWEINTTFTFSCSVARKVNTTANFNASSTGTLYAGGTIPDVNFATNGDQLKLRHNFSLSEG